MRKLNSYLCVLMIALFLVHAIAGGYQMAGIIPGGDEGLTAAAWLLLAVVLIHTVIGLILTADTVKKALRSGVFYPRENILFIVRRVSGFLMLILTACHVIIFSGTKSMGGVRLSDFDGLQLVLSILLIVCLIIHLICNIRPLCISLGIGKKHLRRDAAVILAAILVFAAAMFAYYYYRWNLGWR